MGKGLYPSWNLTCFLKYLGRCFSNDVCLQEDAKKKFGLGIKILGAMKMKIFECEEGVV